jgi:hypothetical protein
VSSGVGRLAAGVTVGATFIVGARVVVVVLPGSECKTCNSRTEGQEKDLMLIEGAAVGDWVGLELEPGDSPSRRDI